ncbi:hypothetical protein [Halovulum sp. GXIMD14793]
MTDGMIHARRRLYRLGAILMRAVEPSKSILRVRRCVPLAALLIGSAVPATGSEEARGFVAFALERCIGPMEQKAPPSKEGMKLSARSVALIPGLSNTALAYETQDGLYFISIDKEKSFSRCTVGLRNPNLRHIAEEHAVVIDVFQQAITVWLAENRYEVSNLVEEETRLEIDLTSTDWREPQLQIHFFSDPELGRLHLFAQDIKLVVEEEAEES